MQPAISWLEGKGLHRGLSVSLIMVGVVSAVAAFLALIVPVVIAQLGQLIEAAPGALQGAQRGNGALASFAERFNILPRLQDLGEIVPDAAIAAATGLTVVIFATVTVFILTAYFAGAIPQFRRGIARVLHKEHREDFLKILESATVRIGMYLIGNLIVSAVAGFSSFIVLSIIGVPYTLALVAWIAITDVIPTVGAYLGAIPALIVAAFVGWPEFFATLAYFIVYQQIENYLIQPRVMKRAIDMSPAAVIVAVLVGATLFGVIGALLALPVAAVLKIALDELYLQNRVEEVIAADARTARRRRFLGRRKRPA